MALALPAALRRTAARDPRLRPWLTTLPGTVDAAARRWSLTVGAPFQPGGGYSWVAPARALRAGPDVRGHDLVLKIGWRDADSEHEADGLRAWHGRGAVEVFDTWVDGTTAALLLERCRPGTPLGGEQQDEVVAAMLRNLWHEPAPGHPFPTLVSMCDRWAARAGARPLDPGLVRAGMELYRSLPRDPGPSVLLVTDLHAGNILDGGADGWRLIDPKPHVGDPCYDVLQHLLNQPERLLTAPHDAAARMADLAGLDRERVERWLFARCVQGVADMPWLSPVAAALG